MREVVISKIQIHELKEEQLIFLKEKNGERVFPVVIGIPEVNAIKIAISEFKVPRPLTHDLLANTISSLGGVVSRVVIDNLEDNVFFAKIVVKKEDGEEVALDARPSDSIALAARVKAPIFVEDVVIDSAGMRPE